MNKNKQICLIFWKRKTYFQLELLNGQRTEEGREEREGCMINPQGFPDPWDGMGGLQCCSGGPIYCSAEWGERHRVINIEIRSPRGGHYHLIPRTLHCTVAIFVYKHAFVVSTISHIIALEISRDFLIFMKMHGDS